MNIPGAIGRVAWRMPGEHKINCLTSEKGNDEFIIAPFNKTDPVILLKGICRETEKAEISNFFSAFELPPGTITQSTEKAAYIACIEKAIEAIKENKFEKVVPARAFVFEKTINLHSLFLKLEEQYPLAFVYCFCLDNGLCMIGASPETLLEKKGDKLMTEALGGTEQEYGYSEKEYLEHWQIISDISQKLDALGYTYHLSETEKKPAGNVAHLSTAFDIAHKSTAEDTDLAGVLHPTAAVCGLPYAEAIKFLKENEDFRRNYYSGYLGPRQKNSFRLFVNLRCAEISLGRAVLYAGAGINSDSVPENEWDETDRKLDTLLKWL
jgi:isochorismate synthase